MSKKLYRTTANVTIFVINTLISTFIEWQIVLYPFLIKVLFIPVILQSHFSILWLPMRVIEGVILPFCILNYLPCHIKILMTQKYAFCSFKYRFDNWRWRKLTFWRNTVTHSHIILKIVPNVVSILHIGLDMTFIDIHRQFRPSGHCLNSSNCN